jgi:hypothetical protein
MRGMRTTVDIPDELFRRTKSEAALRGCKLKELVEEGLRLVLENDKEDHSGQSKRPTRRKQAPSAHDLLKDLCGIYKDGPEDLSTNKKYFDDFGK